MTESIVNIAEASTVNILEGAAFIFTEKLAPEEIPQVSESWTQIGVRLEYEGPHSGELRMWIDEPLSKIIAQNMLGLEESEECSEEKEMDAVKEILNMILGNYLTEAFGTEDIYHLGIPRIIPGKLFEESVECPLRFWLSAEEHPMLVSIHPIK